MTRRTSKPDWNTTGYIVCRLRNLHTLQEMGPAIYRVRAKVYENGMVAIDTYTAQRVEGETRPAMAGLPKHVLTGSLCRTIEEARMEMTRLQGSS